MRLGCVAGLLLFTSSAFAQTWEPVAESDGIQVWQRPVHDSSLVEFRGRGVVNASLRQILAVLSDAHRKTEWMQNCVENRVVRAKSVGHKIIYNRTGSTIPLVADRDVVVETSFAAWPEKRQVVIDAWSTEDPAAPKVDGVVRMPDLHLQWTLVVIDRDRTDVTYQVKADPGGALPAFAVNFVAKNIPLYTIQKLRTQVKKDYSKELAIIDAAFDWSSVEKFLSPPHQVAP